MSENTPQQHAELTLKQLQDIIGAHHPKIMQILASTELRIRDQYGDENAVGAVFATYFYYQKIINNTIINMKKTFEIDDFHSKGLEELAASWADAQDPEQKSPIINPQDC